MPSVYLQESDYASYGVPDATVPQVWQASAIIDGYLNKPDGLIYIVDEENKPAAMAVTGLPIALYTELPFKHKLQLSYSPVKTVLSVYGDSNPLDIPNFVEINKFTWLPDGQLWLSREVCNYVNIKVEYVAGWLYENLPSAIKQACANIINMNNNDNDVSGPVVRRRAGGSEIEYAAPRGCQASQLYLDAATVNMLAPYRRIFA